MASKSARNTTAIFHPECQAINQDGTKDPNREGRTGSNLRSVYYKSCGCYKPHHDKLMTLRKKPRRDNPTGMDILADKDPDSWCVQDITLNKTGRCNIQDNEQEPTNFDWTNKNKGGAKWSSVDILNCNDKISNCVNKINDYRQTCIQNSDESHDDFLKRVIILKQKWHRLNENVYQAYWKDKSLRDKIFTDQSDKTGTKIYFTTFSNRN